MSLRPVAHRYAKSLLETLPDEATVARVDGDLSGLLATLRVETELRRALVSPIVPLERKRAAFRALGGGRFAEPTVRFLEYLAWKGRSGILIEVMEEWNELLRARRGEVLATVLSAVAMDAAQADAIRALVSKRLGRTVVIDHKVDASLIGGFQVFFENRVMDFSLKGRLQRLKEKLHAA
ncbi:MAG: ATP synthase F1 subunit delta [Spirochaetes bacterium]|nr:ATP synthase F1 subunit delta [Spirochaetota bacterium]